MYNISLATLVIAKSHNLTSSFCEIKNALYFYYSFYFIIMSFQYRKEAFSIEEAVIYLKNFDANNTIHVVKIESPEGGQL
jgi:hypothetical protein